MNQIIKREQVIVASILTADPKDVPGPCVCTALAYWPYWESPEASKVAEAITMCMSNNIAAVPDNVRDLLDSDFRKWVSHPVFKDGLPFELAEVEAKSLLPHYKNKRIVESIGRAYSVLIDNPDAAIRVAKSLMVTLGDAV